MVELGLVIFLKQNKNILRDCEEKRVSHKPLHSSALDQGTVQTTDLICDRDWGRGWGALRHTWRILIEHRWNPGGV